jgi:hypothetical protein
MIRPDFLSSADRLELEACLRRQREDHGIARRANAILLLDDGKSCQEISNFLYLDDDTIRGWYKSYRQDGWDALAFDCAFRGYPDADSDFIRTVIPIASGQGFRGIRTR